VLPGGEEDGRTPCIIRREEPRDTRKTRGTRPIALLPFARWALPTCCLFAGDRKFEKVQGASRGRRDVRMALLPLAPSPFAVSSAAEGWSWPVSTPLALKSLEDFLALRYGVVETPAEGFPSLSSSCSPASTPAREGNHQSISCTLPQSSAG